MTCRMGPILPSREMSGCSCPTEPLQATSRRWTAGTEARASPMGVRILRSTSHSPPPGPTAPLPRPPLLLDSTAHCTLLREGNHCHVRSQPGCQPHSSCPTFSRGPHCWPLCHFRVPCPSNPYNYRAIEPGCCSLA